MIYIWLMLGFVGLILGGNFLVDGSVKLAHRMGISPLLIGLTLVGFGTSSPELVTSLLAAFNESSGIAVGNVIGSNIANILLILGVTALLSPIKVDTKSFLRDGSFLLISTIGLITSFVIGKINFIMGLVLDCLVLFYIIYSYITDKNNQPKEEKIEEKSNFLLAFGQAVIGILLTIGGAKLLVTNAVKLAETWHISQAIIGVTMVAIGTSLPELMTAIISAIRKQNDIALGNVVGSNIFNSLFILGTVALFVPISIPANMEWDISIMTIATITLFIIALWRKNISRIVGVVFLATYILYIWKLFV